LRAASRALSVRQGRVSTTAHGPIRTLLVAQIDGRDSATVERAVAQIDDAAGERLKYDALVPLDEVVDDGGAEVRVLAGLEYQVRLGST
jgi:hypothetical protein